MNRIPVLATVILSSAASAQSVSPTMSDDLRVVQESVVENGRSGSNVMLVVKDGKVVHRHVENSGRKGDRDALLQERGGDGNLTGALVLAYVLFVRAAVTHYSPFIMPPPLLLLACRWLTLIC